MDTNPSKGFVSVWDLYGSGLWYFSNQCILRSSKFVLKAWGSERHAMERSIRNHVSL
jgi:hypothetical protein